VCAHSYPEYAIVINSEGAVRKVNLDGSEVTTFSLGPYFRPVGVALSKHGGFFLVLSAETSGLYIVKAPTFQPVLLTSRPFSSPVGIELSPDETYALICETSNHIIYKVSMDGTTSVFAGAGFWGTGEGTGSGIQFASPQSLAFSPDGTFILVVEYGRIRKLDISTGIDNPPTSSTIAGDGTFGYNNAIGSAAQFAIPTDVIISRQGDYALVADSAYSYIRKIDLTTFQVTTMADLKIVSSQNPSRSELQQLAWYANYTSCVATMQDSFKKISMDVQTQIVTVKAGDGQRQDVDSANAITASFSRPVGIRTWKCNLPGYTLVNNVCFSRSALSFVCTPCEAGSYTSSPCTMTSQAVCKGTLLPHATPHPPHYCPCM
jgi:hypothetical protein